MNGGESREQELFILFLAGSRLSATPSQFDFLFGLPAFFFVIFSRISQRLCCFNVVFPLSPAAIPPNNYYIQKGIYPLLVSSLTNIHRPNRHLWMYGRVNE